MIGLDKKLSEKCEREEYMFDKMEVSGGVSEYINAGLLYGAVDRLSVDGKVTFYIGDW